MAAVGARRRLQSFDDDHVSVSLILTCEQLREINRRGGLGFGDGKARGEYIVGCLFDEPHDELLERVHRTAGEQRAQFRAEVDPIARDVARHRELRDLDAGV